MLRNILTVNFAFGSFVWSNTFLLGYSYGGVMKLLSCCQLIHNMVALKSLGSCGKVKLAK